MLLLPLVPLVLLVVLVLVLVLALVVVVLLLMALVVLALVLVWRVLGGPSVVQNWVRCSYASVFLEQWTCMVAATSYRYEDDHEHE